jgi:hypothetical protein
MKPGGIEFLVIEAGSANMIFQRGKVPKRKKKKEKKEEGKILER